MKKIIIFYSLFLFMFSCNFSINGEGIATAQKEYVVDKIEDLNISCNCNVILVPGSKTNLKIDSHQNIIDNLNIKTKKNSLFIKEKKHVEKYSSYDVYVYVTRDLKKIILDKQSSLTTSGTLNVDQLEISTTDQANISQTYLITDKLDVKSKHQSTIYLAGTVEKLKIKASGETKLYLDKYEANEVNFHVQDKVMLDINVRQILSGSATDNSTVTFIGDPNKELKITDQAQVLKK